MPHLPQFICRYRFHLRHAIAMTIDHILIDWLGHDDVAG